MLIWKLAKRLFMNIMGHMLIHFGHIAHIENLFVMKKSCLKRTVHFYWNWEYGVAVQVSLALGFIIVLLCKKYHFNIKLYNIYFILTWQHYSSTTNNFISNFSIDKYWSPSLKCMVLSVKLNVLQKSHLLWMLARSKRFKSCMLSSYSLPPCLFLQPPSIGMIVLAVS